MFMMLTPIRVLVKRNFFFLRPCGFEPQAGEVQGLRATLGALE
jgi:hypothetical protein